MDWHPAPRRQYVIILTGQLEIGLGDGTTRRFGPGDARLVEDTTGQGHTTRVGEGRAGGDGHYPVGRVSPDGRYY